MLFTLGNAGGQKDDSFTRFPFWFSGYYSHRETINGSWYIQDLCELLQTYGGSLEFTELLTLVNRKVSMRRVGNCNDRSAIGKKQVPCFASMLTKKLYFRPKK